MKGPIKRSKLTGWRPLRWSSSRSTPSDTGSQSDREAVRARQAFATVILRQYWGFTDFRPAQREVINSVLEKRDTLGLLPTGGGKSICFQVPGIVFGGVTLVISPLISLMHDQVAGLTMRGIHAFSMTGRVEPAVFKHVLTRMKEGPFFLYLAPERLRSSQVRRLVQYSPVRLIAVDEAHCISSWGHDFRPAYRAISELRNALPDVPMCAVTATATPRTRRDIIYSLKMRSARTIQSSFDRPNIHFSIAHEMDARASVLSRLKSTPGPAILYESTRQGVEIWAEKLARAGISARGYHGGMEQDERERNQTAWMEKTVRVMVATNAFGMGIDRTDVRLVLHVGLPASLEAYYQEAGRAGRDGRPAQAEIIVTPEARVARLALLKEGAFRKLQVRRSRRLFGYMRRYVDRPLCRRWGLLGYFAEFSSQRCGNCDVCARHLP